jgi:hypothetical protein
MVQFLIRAGKTFVSFVAFIEQGERYHLLKRYGLRP